MTNDNHDAGADRAANSNDMSPDGGEDLVRIGEMAKRFGVTLRTLRFYEDKGLINPQRDGATRLYSRRDRARLKLILLGRKIGFSLRDVKQMMDLYDPSGTNSKQLRVALDKSEKQLGRLQKQRARDRRGDRRTVQHHGAGPQIAGRSLDRTSASRRRQEPAARSKRLNRSAIRTCKGGLLWPPAPRRPFFRFGRRLSSGCRHVAKNRGYRKKLTFTQTSIFAK